MSNVVIDARRVRPIALNGDEREPLAIDEFARDSLPHTIKLGGAMSGFAEKNDACIADPLEQWFEVR